MSARDPDLVYTHDLCIRRAQDYRQAKWEAEQARMAQDAARDEVTVLLDALGQKSITFHDDVSCHQVTVTAVPSSTVSIDEDRLKKQIGAHHWKAVSKRVLDKALLNDAVASGLIDIEVVAECSTIKDRATSLRINEKDE